MSLKAHPLLAAVALGLLGPVALAPEPEEETESSDPDASPVRGSLPDPEIESDLLWLDDRTPTPRPD